MAMRTIRKFSLDGTFEDVVEDDPLADELPDPKAVTISRRQFFQQMSRSGTPPYISRANALAVLGGGVPPEMQLIIDTLPEAMREDAAFFVGGARDFDITNPLVAGFAAYLGLTAEQVQALWNAAAKL